MMQKQNLDFQYGTAFYAVTEDQLKDYYKDEENGVIRYLVEEYGFDVFDLEKLYGSATIDGVLYICDTDGVPIEVDGQEVDPEDALETFSIDELAYYIIDADDSIIKRYLTDHELAEFNIDEVAYSMISGVDTFSDVVRWIDELGLLNDII